MKPINILVVTEQFDLVAQGILNHAGRREDIRLLTPDLLKPAQVQQRLAELDTVNRLGIVFVGEVDTFNEYAVQWAAEFPTLVMVRVVLGTDRVFIEAPKLELESLLSTVCTLIEHQSPSMQQRVAEVQLRTDHQDAGSKPFATDTPPPERPLLAAALRWMNALLLQAVQSQSSNIGDIPGLTVTAETVKRALAAQDPIATVEHVDAAGEAEAALMTALQSADPASEPLAALYRNLDLDALEWRLLLLALAPELDIRYQKCIGFLLDDMGRRVGTLGLFSAVLGDAAKVRSRLAAAGGLLRWRLLVCDSAIGLTADAPIRVDPAIVAWVLGQSDALMLDARLRPVLRTDPWPGAALLRRPLERAHAARVVGKLRETSQSRWIVLSGADLSGWRALLELGAQAQQAGLLRCEAARIAVGDRSEVEDVSLRLVRAARLTGQLIVIDAAADVRAEHHADSPPAADADVLRMLASAVMGAGRRAAIIASEPADIFPAIGSSEAALLERPTLDARTRESIVLAAANDLGLALNNTEALGIGTAFPLQVDGLHLASRLARARARRDDTPQQLHDKLLTAYRSTASRNISKLAHRIQPKFELDDVILPRERRNQLDEIVDNVRLAPKVLDEWRFGEKLPYGRGVAVLFHGASGTGKTMAAQAIANKLGIEIFALDLSRVVSKYIGDTEKNIDAVFTDAQHSGAAVLIDEADALFGKRSEVKDAHDRYANIEVAYLLQRMEDFDGLAILTTNIRQNLDQAFLRRLRFVIEFPRPDARARESIWRQCLPGDTHDLSDAEMRLLARKVELTGGHIRQITLRAAFAAAAADARISMRHINQAMNAELTKLGLPTMNLEPAEKAA